MARRRWHFLMTPLEHGFIRGLDDRYRGWLTPQGRMLLWAGTASGVMLLGGLLATQVALFGMLVSLMLLALVLGMFFRPQVKLTRELGAFPSAGQTWTYRVRVENVGSRPLYNGCVEERGLPFEDAIERWSSDPQMKKTKGLSKYFPAYERPPSVDSGLPGLRA